jgi:hypothetical protein
MEQQQQTSFPDASLRWNASPPFLRRIVQSIGANVGYRRGQNDRTTPIEAVTGGVQRIHDQSLDLPSSASIAWAFAGGFTTTAGYNLRQSATASAAGTSRSQSGNTVFDVGRSFKLPASWNIRDGVSTRLGVQNTRSNAYVGALGTDGLLLERPRDASGRHEVHFNADTRVSETLSSSLVFSRVVNYNDVTNTRFSQMVLTAVLQLNFFAGDLK